MKNIFIIFCFLFLLSKTSLAQVQIGQVNNPTEMLELNGNAVLTDKVILNQVTPYNTSLSTGLDLIATDHPSIVPGVIDGKLMQFNGPNSVLPVIIQPYSLTNVYRDDVNDLNLKIPADKYIAALSNFQAIPSSINSGAEPNNGIFDAGRVNANDAQPSRYRGRLVIDLFAAPDAQSGYLIEVKGNTAGNFTNFVSVFVDWNRDGDFSDEREVFHIGTITNSNGSGTAETDFARGYIYVPSFATGGNVRMRVVKRRSGYVNRADLCASNPATTNLGIGQAEDYTINITGRTNTGTAMPTYCSITFTSVEQITSVTLNGAARTSNTTAALENFTVTALTSFASSNANTWHLRLGSPTMNTQYTSGRYTYNFDIILFPNRFFKDLGTSIYNLGGNNSGDAITSPLPNP